MDDWVLVASILLCMPLFIQRNRVDATVLAGAENGFRTKTRRPVQQSRVGRRPSSSISPGVVLEGRDADAVWSYMVIVFW